MLKEQDTRYVLEFVDDDKKKGPPWLKNGILV